jgi:hypothetical protein
MCESMIPEKWKRFSERIMLKQKLDLDPIQSNRINV